MEKKIDLKEKFTTQLIKSLEKNIIPWQKPWVSDNRKNRFKAHNVITNVDYKGINTLLSFSPEVSETMDGRFLTFNQARDKGYQIVKGSKGYPVFYYGKSEKEQEDGEKKEYFFLKYFTVFHVSQLDKPFEQEIEKPFNTEPNVAVMDLVAKSGAKYKIGGDSAHYSIKEDCIFMPDPSLFKNEESFAKTFLHELAHWTGHTSRLNRGFTNDGKDSEEYAKEELRAELASAFMGLDLGMNGCVDNHKSYIKHYLSILKKDKNEIFKACKDAQKICDFLNELKPELKIDF